MAVKRGIKLAKTKSKSRKHADEMSPELLGVLNRIRELLSSSGTQEAEAKYKVGHRVLDAQSDPRKYGKQVVVRLAEALGCGKDLLYWAARVAKTWNEREFAALLRRKNSRDLPLSFSHFEALSLEERRDVREALIREVLKKGLNSDETSRLVKAKQKPRVGRSRRTPTQTQDAPDYEVLTQLLKHSEAQLNEIARVEDALAGLVEGTVTPKLEELLQRAADEQHKLRERSAYIAQRLEAVRERVHDKLATQAQHEAAQVSPATEGEVLPSRPLAGGADFRDVPKIDGPAGTPGEDSGMAHQGP